MVSRHWLYFGGFVITGILLIGATLMGIVDGLSALSGSVPASEEFILLAMLGEAAEWVMIVLVLGLFAVVFLAVTVISVLRTASLPRDDRLVSIVEWVERRYPVLRRFDVTEKVSPTSEDQRQQLKDQYISGEISDAEFEREMGQLMDDATSKEKSQSRTETAIEIDDKSR
ncbi:SHOCT domain-containing protein [Natronococcus wangiae]|uniref:SHOCT domain-containing protein n=1 Tax=Natronococcus wangiae TaxID=3068275 RepID=UPI00273EEC84|nr:SHOCT domain-containing protein [Natronococcus sp. AD5]